MPSSFFSFSFQSLFGTVKKKNSWLRSFCNPNAWPSSLRAGRHQRLHPEGWVGVCIIYPVAECQSAGLNYKLSTLGLVRRPQRSQWRNKSALPCSRLGLQRHRFPDPRWMFWSCFFSFEQFSWEIERGTAGAAWGYVDAEQNPTEQIQWVTALHLTQVTHATSIFLPLRHCVFLSLSLVPPHRAIARDFLQDCRLMIFVGGPFIFRAEGQLFFSARWP